MREAGTVGRRRRDSESESNVQDTAILKTTMGTNYTVDVYLEKSICACNKISYSWSILLASPFDTAPLIHKYKLPKYNTLACPMGLITLSTNLAIISFSLFDACPPLPKTLAGVDRK